MIKLLLCILTFCLNFLLSQCSVTQNCDNLTAEKSKVSEDGKIKLELGVSDSAIILKLTNISFETLSVATGDVEGGFFYGITMYDHESKKISHADYCSDLAFDATKVNFSKAFVELEPGKSVCKVYRENERVYGHQLACSFEGRRDITRHTYRMPLIKDISRVRIAYDTDWILWDLVNKSGQEVPKNAFLGAEIIEWNREPQEQE